MGAKSKDEKNSRRDQRREDGKARRDSLRGRASKKAT
jgi:hypothetical protein